MGAEKLKQGIVSGHVVLLPTDEIGNSLADKSLEKSMISMQ
jgi:hypothetical protein